MLTALGLWTGVQKSNARAIDRLKRSERPVKEVSQETQAACCDEEGTQFTDAESYFYEDYNSWPEWIIIDGRVVSCKTYPIDCFDALTHPGPENDNYDKVIIF